MNKYKKYILGFVVLGLLIGLPLTTKASTLSDIEARIASLTNQINSLSAKLGAQVISTKTVTPISVLLKTSVSTTQKLTASTDTIAPKLPNLPAGCSSPVGFSMLTGVSCGCNNGNVYSDYNGQLCPTNSKTVKTINTPVKTTTKLTPAQTTKITTTASSDLNKRVDKIEIKLDQILKMISKLSSVISLNSSSGNQNNNVNLALTMYCNGLYLGEIDITSPILDEVVDNAIDNCMAGGGRYTSTW